MGGFLFAQQVSCFTQQIEVVFEQTGVVTSTQLNISIIFTTVTPLRLADELVSTPADKPQHVFCNVDQIKLQTAVLLAINISSKLNSLKTLSLLVPWTFIKRDERYLLMSKVDCFKYGYIVLI
jgi:hypothetical protein